MMFSCISLLKDNQSTWVMIHSIIRERSWVDCFSLRPYICISFIHCYIYMHDCLSTSHVLIACDDVLCSQGIFLSIHCICVLAMQLFFFNQPTKYRRQSGARRSTTVRTIVVIIVLYHSSYPLEQPLFPRTLRL